MTAIEIGRLLRTANTGFVVGCRVNQLDSPSFGALARVPLENGYQIYGLIHDIHIDDDGLVRQLITADGVDENIIADNRINRNIPVEMGVLAIGYRQKDRIYHQMPPRPPLSLDQIYLCEPDELYHFTRAGRFGYFRLILRQADLPVAELIAAHLHQAHEVHCQYGNQEWTSAATQELITLLRDDYQTLMGVLGAVSEVLSIG